MSLLYPHKKALLRATSSALACSVLSGSQAATLKADRTHSRALARHNMAKKIFRRHKSHYTAPACGFWIIKIFSFIFLQTIPADRASAGGFAESRN
jgi:hypothetical protein